MKFRAINSIVAMLISIVVVEVVVACLLIGLRGRPVNQGLETIIVN